MRPISNGHLQPPPPSDASITPYMRDSMARLHSMVESNQVADAKSRRTTSTTATRSKRDKNTDYGLLIGRWLTSIPPQERLRKYRMTELVAALAGTGRYEYQPATRLIGTALHQAGWTTCRSYEEGSRNTRWWTPPTQDLAVTAPPTHRRNT